MQLFEIIIYKYHAVHTLVFTAMVFLHIFKIKAKKAKSLFQQGYEQHNF